MKTLEFKIKVNSETGEVVALRKEFENLDNTTQKASVSAEKFYTRVTQMAHFTAISATIYELSASIKELTKSFIETSAKFEKFSLILETLEGNSKKAQQDLEWIKSFAKTTPYEIDQVTEAFVKLKSYGFNATKELKVLGDTAAAMGKPLDMAVEAIADAVTGEFERLKEFGVKAYQQGEKVAFTWADASGKARYIVVDNNREVIESTLTTIWNSKYQGAMDKLSMSWDGIISNMKDTWTNFKADTAKLSFKEAKKDLFVLQQVWNETLNDMKPGTSTILTEIVQDVRKAIIGIAVLEDSVMDLGSLIKHLFLGILYSFDEMAYSIPAKVEDMINKIIPLLNKLPGVNISLLHQYNDTAKSFKNAAINEFKLIGEVWERITKGKIGDITKYWLENFAEGDKKLTEALKKHTKAQKEIGTVGKFNRDLLKDDTKELEKQQNIYDQIHSLYVSLLPKEEQLNEWKKEELKKINEIQDATLKQKALKELEVVYEAKRVNLLNKQNKIYDEQYKKAQEILNSLQNSQKSKLELLNEEYSKKEAILKLGLKGEKLEEALKLLQEEKTKKEKQIQEELHKQLIENFKKEYKTLSDGIDALQKTLDDEIFGFLTGKFKTLGDFVEDLFKNVGNSIARSLSQSISKSITDSITAALATSASKNTISTTATTLNAALRGREYNQNSSIITADKLKYGAYGAIGGYAAGSLGDKLFGADTKASQYGAIGGGIGGLVGGPTGAIIGAGVGSLIGGAFSSGWKTTLSEYIVKNTQDAYSDFVDVLYYQVKEKNSWFSHKSKDIEKALTDTEKFFIQDLLHSMETFVDSIGNGLKNVNDILLFAGKYNNNSLNELLAKETIGNIVGLKNSSINTILTSLKEFENYNLNSYSENSYKSFYRHAGVSKNRANEIINLDASQYEEYLYKNFDDLKKAIDKAIEKGFLDEVEIEKYKRVNEIYEIWKDYAKSIDKSVTEAMQEVIGGLVKFKQDYQVWLYKLNGNDIKAIEYQRNILKEQISYLSNQLGADNVNKDNYLELLNSAIQESPTPEVIKKWEALGQLIQQDAELQKQYNELLEKNNQITKEKIDIQSILNEYEDKYKQLTLDSEKYQLYQLEKTKENIDNLANSLNISNVTFDNFIDKVKDLNVTSQETADNIKALGDALIREQEIKNAISDSIEPQLAKYEEALNTISPRTINNVDELLKTIKTAKVDDVNFILGEINKLKQKEIENAQKLHDERVEQLKQEQGTLDNISRALDNLKAGAENLRATALSGTTYAQGKYFEYYNRVKFDLINSKDPTNDITALVNYASAYQEYLKNTSTSEEEYLYQVNTIANQMEDLANKYDVKTQTEELISAIAQTDYDLQNKIDTINQTYQQYTDQLKVTIEQQYLDYVTTTKEQYENYLGENSPIISKLTDLQSNLVSAINGISINVVNDTTTSNNSGRGGGDLITQAYQDVLGRAPDSEGAAYWNSQLASGAVSTSDLKTAIANAAVSFDVNSYSGSVDTATLESSISNAESWLNTHKFADGGIVTKPTLGLIGEAGYPEAVIPFKDPSDPLALKTVANEIRALRNEVAELKRINMTYQAKIEENTRPIKNTQRYA